MKLLDKLLWSCSYISDYQNYKKDTTVGYLKFVHKLTRRTKKFYLKSSERNMLEIEPKLVKDKYFKKLN